MPKYWTKHEAFPNHFARICVMPSSLLCVSTVRLGFRNAEIKRKLAVKWQRKYCFLFLLPKTKNAQLIAGNPQGGGGGGEPLPNLSCTFTCVPDTDEKAVRLVGRYSHSATCKRCGSSYRRGMLSTRLLLCRAALPPIQRRHRPDSHIYILRT